MDNEMRMFEPIEQLLERLSVNSVFGTPTQAGNVTVIPVAQVGMGFGYGFGTGTNEGGGEAGSGGQAPSSGTGGGGGGAGNARPVGVIRVAGDGVEFEPMIDVPRLGIAGILFAGWTVFWIAQTIMAFRRGR